MVTEIRHGLAGMRLRVGELHEPLGPEPDPAMWTRILSPSSPASRLAVWVVGIAALSAALAFVIAASLSRLPFESPGPSGGIAPWGVVPAILIVSIPAHEILHALFCPGGLFSPAVTFLVWPRRLRFGVYYEGTISRRRWLVARVAPFGILAVVPALALATAPGPLDPSLSAALSLLLLVNSLGSGGDLLAAGWVILRIPRGSTLGFFSGRAYRKI
jgi:hypothetical protein